jgi:hypothetical protein
MRDMAAGAAFTILLVAQLSAIEDQYQQHARDFCLLEAGAITQLLETTAHHHGVGLCQVGAASTDPVRAALALDDDHEVLHALVGGVPATTRPAPAGGLPARLRQHLADRLPDYMVPPQITILPQLPLTAQGKVDRSALADLAGADRAGGADPVAPRTKLERHILVECAQVLGRTDRIGATERFFDLGATSVDLTRLYNRLTETLDATHTGKLNLLALFENPSPRLLADWLESGTDAAGQALLDAARRAETRVQRRAVRRGAL